MQYFDDVVIGTRRELGCYTFTAARIKAFAAKYDPQAFHLDEAAGKAKGGEKKALTEAFEEVEDEEDEHLYHSSGWCRELWIDSLGLPAVLPPPEEEKEVKTAIGAARAKKARKEML